MVLLSLLLAACAPAAPPQPRRAHPTFVSLNPCSDAILAEVADPAQILALSHFSHDPAASSMGVEKARRFRSVSGSVEELLALRPDMIVADQFVPPASAAALNKLGLPLVSLPIVASVDQARAQVRQLARLAGHPARGEALVARIDAALTRAAPPPGSAPISAVVWQAGGIVPGADTLIADLLARTGFANFAAAKGLRQADLLPLEPMLADPPRLILPAGNPYSGENRLLTHPALAALEETARVPLDPALLWCGGPSIIAAAERLALIRRALGLAQAAEEVR